MIVRTELWALLAIVVGALLLWPMVSFVISRIRGVKTTPTPIIGDQTLYLTVSRLSHRLKTVGQIVIGQLSGFSDQLPSDENRWKVARNAILEEAEVVDHLTQRLDLIVNLGMTGQPLVMEPINVAALIEKLIIALAPAGEKKGVKFGEVFRPEQSESAAREQTEPAMVSGSPAALNEIFSNLLENALKHNGTGTTISSEVERKGGEVVVTIADTGSGIPSELLESMFGKGNRKYVPGQKQGTGVGMHISKLLTELHGGHITVASSPENGTKFTITFPVLRSQ